MAISIDELLKDKFEKYKNGGFVPPSPETTKINLSGDSFPKPGDTVTFHQESPKTEFKPPKTEADYDLKPGDTAYASKYGHIYVEHADGSWTSHTLLTDKSQVNHHYSTDESIIKFFKSKVKSGTLTQIAAIPGPKKDKEVVDGTKYLKGNVFTHPISKAVVFIEPGETLLQHSFAGTSYLVLNADGSMKTKITSLGKVQKAGNNIQPLNYFEIFKAPQPQWQKSINNVHGFPAFGTADEIVAFLNDLPVGAKIHIPQAIWWSATKQSPTSWKISTGDFWLTVILAGIITAWSDSHKAGIKVDTGVKLNKQGIPVYDLEAFTKWAKDLPVGTVVGVQTPAPGMKKAAAATKTGDDEWTDDATFKDTDTASLAKAIIANKAGKAEEFEIKSTPKAPAPDAMAGIVGTPTIEITDPYQFSSYYSKKVFQNLNYDLCGTKDSFSSNWYQQDLLYYVSGTESQMKALAKDKFGKAILDAVATLEYAKKNAGLESGDKAKATKMIKKLNELYKYHQAAKKLNDNELPESDPVDLGFVWGNKNTWVFEMSSAVAVLQKRYAEVKFAKESSNLGWDVFNGTDQQYSDYLAGTEYASWIKYLTSGEVKKLALHDMKAPNQGLHSYYISAYKSKVTQAKFKEEVAAELEKHADEILALKEFPSKPDFLDDNTWDTVKFLLSGKCQLELPDSAWTKDSMQETFGHLVEFIPPEAPKVLGGYFSAVGGGDSYFSKTLHYLVQSGIWNEDASTYEVPNYGKVPLTSGMQVKKYSGKFYFIPKGPTQGYFGLIDSDGGFSRTYLYNSNDPILELLYTAPTKVTLKDAKNEGRNFDADSWGHLESVEDSTEPITEFTGEMLVSLNKALGPKAPVKVSELTDKAKTLIGNFPGLADMIVFKDQKGHYKTAEDVVSQGPSTAWDELLLKPDVPPPFLKVGDETDPDEIQNLLDLNYSSSVLASAFYWLTCKDWEVTDEYDYPEEELRDEITKLQHTSLAHEVDAPQGGKFGTLHPLPDQGLGGGRPKKYYANKDGEIYLAKYNNCDPFMVDVEYAAVEIGKAFGFVIPPADIREIDGDYSYVQFVVPALHSLATVNPNNLTDTQLIDVMASHPLDWAISNHDANGSQFLLQSDGKILKIDLGQAWKHLVEDCLDVGYQPPENPDPVWYDRFYNRVIQGTFDYELLNKVTKAVLTKARRISTTKDALFQKYVGLAFEKRNNFPDGRSREEFIELAMVRKHQTFDDFFGFYKDLYAEGDYNFPFTEEEFDQTTLAGSFIHLSPTPEFVEQIKFVKGHGKPLFFATPDIEDVHALFYTSKGSKGTTLHADMKIRTDGDAAIKAWIKAQGVSVSSTFDPATVMPSSDASQGFSTKDVQTIQHLVAFAKTVSHHQTDGEYNQGTIGSAKNLKADLLYKRNQINGALDKDVLYRHPDFQTGHQQFAWLEWADKTLKSFDQVEEALQAKQKAPIVETEVTYTPPAGIVVTKKPQAIETVERSGVLYTKYNDFIFVAETGSVKFQIPQQDYETIQALEGSVTTDLETKEESKQVVAAPHYTVTKSVFQTPLFGKIENDGTLIENGWQTFQSNAYDITSSEHPGIKIHYFPHGPCKDETNPGRLQIHISNWDGTGAAIDDALGMLTEMGIDTSPADESSLELFYWRHLAGILRQRKLNAQNQKTKDAMDALEHQLAGVEAAEEIEGRKKVFAGLWGEDAVNSVDWRPQVGNIVKHLNPGEEAADVTAGRPHWLRPDFDVAKVREWTKGFLPTRADGYGMEYLLSGIFVSNEEKIRYLGKFGMANGSNSPESDRAQGSGQFGFLRQGQWIGGYGLYLEPWVMARTQNYAFNSDHYGNIATRNMSSPFDLQESINLGSKGGGHNSNELMFKYGVCTWDDVAMVQVDSYGERDKLIAKFKKLGFEEIRGIPVSERIVSSASAAEKLAKKIWDMAEKEQDEQS